MTLLSNQIRPAVEFDPANKEHRKWYREFLSTASWKDCPVRFTVVTEGDEGNTQAIIQRQLIQHYLDKEFKSKESPAAKLKVAR